MITERSPLSFSQVNSHILGGHEEGLCSNQDNQYFFFFFFKSFKKRIINT